MKVHLADLYDAFALAGKSIPLGDASSVGEIKSLDPVSSNVVGCEVQRGHGEDRIVLPESRSGCSLFSSSSPGTISIWATLGDGAKSYDLKFAEGADLGTTTASGGSLDLRPVRKRYPGKAPISVAWFDVVGSKWHVTTVADAGAQAVQLDGLASSGKVFLRFDGTSTSALAFKAKAEIKKELYRFRCTDYNGGVEVVRARGTEFKELEGDGPYRKLNYYLVCIDQATPHGVSQITLNRSNVVRPNYYGMLLVRHWDDVVPVLTYSGASITLSTAGFDDKPPDRTTATLKGEGPSVVWPNYSDANPEHFVVS